MSRPRHELRRGVRVWVRIPWRELSADGRTVHAHKSRRIEVKGTVRRRFMRNGIAGPEPYVLVDLDDCAISAGEPLRFEVAAVRKLGLLDLLAEAAAQAQGPGAQSTGDPET